MPPRGHRRRASVLLSEKEIHMMSYRLICWIAPLLCGAASAYAAHGPTVFQDDFQDKDASDGLPVTWSPVTAGSYDAASGDYVLTPRLDGQNDTLLAVVQDLNLTDVSVRTQVRIRPGEQGEERIGILARGMFPSRGGLTSYIGWLASDGTLSLEGGGIDIQAPFSMPVGQEDVLLQLDVTDFLRVTGGGRPVRTGLISLRAWRLGDPMPDPQITTENSAFVEGFIGVLFQPGASRDSAGVFRYVDVAVPEPATGFLLAIGAFVSLRGRARRQRIRVAP